MYKVLTKLAPRLNQITHLTSDANYTWVHFSDTKPEIYAYPLLWFERRLPQLGLLRIHKTISVRADQITGWERISKLELRILFAGQSAFAAKKRVYTVARHLTNLQPSLFA